MTGAYHGEELDRAIETAAINAIIASQIFHGRGNLPWVFSDTQRKSQIADLLHLDVVESAQAATEHYGIVAAVQPQANPKLDAITKLLESELDIPSENVNINKVAKKVAA